MLGLFNIIVLLIIVHVVLFRMSGGKTSDILICGLFGYLASRERNNFNWDKFNALGMDNDERGGDSIGRAVGDDIRKFVSKKTTTTYKDYVINHKNGEGHHIALGHTRKASVGLVSTDTAQPVVIDLPGENQKFIMVHNGTLHNWEDLAKKYDIESFGKTDSMVLAEIICNYGYGVLLEYIGTAALIIRDDRDPDTLKVFRGMSKAYLQKVEEERPLNYYQESKNSMYISSREEGLYFIGGEIDNVFEFEPNYLYTIHKGEIVSQLLYNRSNCSQIKVWVAPVSTYTKKSYRYTNEEWDEDYSQWKEKDTFSNLYPTKEIFNGSKEYIIKAELIPKPPNFNKIVCSRLRYYFFDIKGVPHYASGLVNMSETGFRNEGKKLHDEKTYYFFAGVMLKDANAFKTVKDTFGKSSKFVDSDTNISKLAEFSQHPICTVDGAIPTYSNIKWSTGKGNAAYYYTGEFTMLFGRRTYTIKSGSCNHIVDCQFSKLPNHSEEANKPVITLPSLYEPKTTKVIGFTPNSSIERVGVFSTAKLGSEDTAPNIADTLIEQEIDEAYAEFEKTQAEELADINQYAIKGLQDGLNAMLLVLDDTITEVELVGAKNNEITNILSNLYQLQDILMEKDKMQQFNLSVGYDEF